MDENNLKDNLENLIFNKLNSYSKSQKPLWRKVPYLALAAQGRGEENILDDLSVAYTEGFWLLRHGMQTMSVDLESGEIGRHEWKAVGFENVVSLLNATRVIDDLKDRIKKPYRSFYNYSWKKDLIKLRRISRNYKFSVKERSKHGYL